MSLWDKPEIPHKGWACIDMIDLGEDADDMDFETRKLELYEQCEMCQQEGIRYVHIMQHPDYESRLRVGCVCAENMENDYLSPKNREKKLINRHKRKMNFLKKEWNRNPKGNFVLKYKGKYITIMPSKYNASQFGVAYNGQYIWEYKKELKDIRTAKLVAFEIFDEDNDTRY